MSILVLLLVIVAMAFAIVELVVSRGRAWLAWGLLALAIAVLLLVLPGHALG